ncbi:MAG TPA: SgcJ/EcaC family oxidoreductase [Streptosporangiaceae bacterium]|nr:SgcJ/EcaC family oxidoreductase [Streptosporangiaceae bacterium]
MSADDAQAVQNVPGRIVAAWAKNDAEAFAAVFTEDGTLILPGDVFLKSREEIRSFMAEAFAGPYKGTNVTGKPLAVKPLADGVALVITQGGVLAAGQAEVSAEQAIRASWLLARQGSEWLITAYQNTPIAG